MASVLKSIKVYSLHVKSRKLQFFIQSKSIDHWNSTFGNFLFGDFCPFFLDLRRAAKVNNRFCGEGYKSLQPTRFKVELCTTTTNEF